MLKIWILNNLELVFKNYLTIVNNWIQKDEKLENDKVLFKAIKKAETWIKAEYKVFANFAITKLNAKSQRRAAKEKKKFVEWPKYKKCGCKHLADQVDKHANKKYNKHYKKRHISHFYNSFTFLNKENTSEGPIASNSDSKKNVSCVIQVVANKMFEIGVTQKIIANSGTTQHFITNCKFIYNYYNNYLEY